MLQLAQTGGDEESSVRAARSLGTKVCSNALFITDKFDAAKTIKNVFYGRQREKKGG